MSRGGKVIYFGLTAAALSLVCVYEASFEVIGDGSVAVTATVRSGKPLQLRRVTFDQLAEKAGADECLRYPQDNECLFRETSIEGPQSFQFEVRISEYVSPFGILKNRFYWRPFAVFRIETDSGRVVFVAAEVSDIRKSRVITIDIQ